MKVISVAADGECLFNAIAFGILYYKFNKKYPTLENYKRLARILREATVAKFERWIHQGDTVFIAILANEYSNIYGKEFSDIVEKAEFYAKKYSDYMAKSTSWGGIIELNAMSKYVHNQGFKGIQIYDMQNKKIPGMNSILSPQGKNTIKLVLSTKNSNGRTYGIHYDFCISEDSVQNKK